MQMKASIAVLVAIVLSGCATSAGQPGSEGGALVASSTPVTTSSATTTGITSGTGTGQPLGSQTDTPLLDGRPDLKRSVFYEFDRYDVKAEYRALVERHARWLAANPKARLTIEGNTDDRGSREYNVALGQRRAESVTSMLVLMGAKPEQIEAVSFGKEKPRAAGHDEAAFAQNRRSDFAGR
jgi:peptidoglycan-associated lipoprotein